MKSKFAKFVDGTLGAALIFLAATAVLRYYTTLSLATFLAVAVTACAVLLLHATGKRKHEKLMLSKAADDMFFDFMFEDDASPAKKLTAALKAKGVNAVRRGGGVYAGSCAAFCAFDDPPKPKQIARIISKAKHYGAKRAVIFSKAPPTAAVEVGDFSVSCVNGNDVYKLFASLGALPAKRERKKHKRFAFAAVLAADKTVRYFVLAAAMFFIGITLKSLITFVCACACAALGVACVVGMIVRKVRIKN